jgi:hypothetical protein
MIALSLGLDVVQTFARVRVLLVGQLIFTAVFAIVGTLAMFIALVLNALQGLRTELRTRK